MLALHRSAEIDWSTVDLVDPFLLYDWESGSVRPLPETVVEDAASGLNQKQRADGERSRARRVLPAVDVKFTDVDNANLLRLRLLAPKFFDVDGTGSDPFDVDPSEDDNVSSCSGVRESLVPNTHEVPGNYYNASTDPVEEVIARFCNLKVVCREKNFEVPPTVGRALTAMSKIVSTPVVDCAEVTRCARPSLLLRLRSSGMVGCVPRFKLVWLLAMSNFVNVEMIFRP